MIYISKLFSPISTGTSAGDIDVGATVKINEYGSPVNYLVVHQGLPGDLYDASCEGTWLLRKDIREKQAWNSSGVSTLAGSTIMSVMAEYMDAYDPGVRTAIKTVKIPYCVGGGSTAINSGLSGLECQLFPLSGYEVGFTTNTNRNFPVDGAKLDYFTDGTNSAANQKRVATLNGSSNIWNLRSAITNRDNFVWAVSSFGSFTSNICTGLYGIRPTMILPYDFVFQKSEVS